MTSLPITIKQLRMELGLTQSELAELLGLGNKSRIAEYENGKQKPSTSVKILLLLLDKKIITPDILRSLKNT